MTSPGGFLAGYQLAVTTHDRKPHRRHTATPIESSAPLSRRCNLSPHSTFTPCAHRTRPGNAFMESRERGGEERTGRLARATQGRTIIDTDDPLSTAGCQSFLFVWNEAPAPGSTCPRSTARSNSSRSERHAAGRMPRRLGDRRPPAGILITALPPGVLTQLSRNFAGFRARQQSETRIHW